MTELQIWNVIMETVKYGVYLGLTIWAVRVFFRW